MPQETSLFLAICYYLQEAFSDLGEEKKQQKQEPFSPSSHMWW